MSGKLITHNIESVFDYDDFTISIDTTNEAYLSVSPLNPRDGGRPIDMVSSFNDFKGKLYIDVEDSKSGRHGGNEEYPYVEVKDSPFKIFYNSRSIVKWFL